MKNLNEEIMLIEIAGVSMGTETKEIQLVLVTHFTHTSNRGKIGTTFAQINNFRTLKRNKCNFN